MWRQRESKEAAAAAASTANSSRPVAVASGAAHLAWPLAAGQAHVNRPQLTKIDPLGVEKN